MKKSFKTVAVSIAVSICAISGIMCGTHAFAYASSVSIEEMKAYLASINMPEVYLRLASDEEIKRDYNAYYGSGVTAETSVSYINESVGEGVMPLDIISEDEMKFTVTATPNLSRSNGIVYMDCVTIMVTYEWTKLPSYKKTDAIVVNWDSNVFTLLSGYFYQFDTRVIGSGSNSYEEHFVIQRPMEINQGGLGYEFSLKGDSSPVTGILGYARFILDPRQTPMYPASGDSSTPHFTTSINAQYCHSWKTRNVSIGFSKSGPSISFSSEYRTDKTATGCNVNYKYEQ